MCNNLRRRDFLIRSGQAAAAAALVPGMQAGALPLSSAEPEFHLHPHYREQAPLESVLHKRMAGLDGFLTETQHDQIAKILMEWRAALRQSPSRVEAIQKVLSPDFEGSSFRPQTSKRLYPGSVLEARRLEFTAERSLGPEAFARELHQYFSDFSKILTAEFQVTGIEPGSNGELSTKVRYELVGTGGGFHREQRVGYWELRWQVAASNEYSVLRWSHTSETRSRSSSPIYQDVTVPAFSANPSYSAQLIHGVDYWRTVLDGSCGIDIYGHNGVSAGDIDGDGWDDLYICQPAGLPNRLYRNRRDGTFEDITAQSGVGVLENTACALFADFQNRGHQDLIVVRSTGPLLFVNDGTGKFRAQPDAFRFATPPQGTFTGAAAADYDRDGWLDIYFCLYVFYQGTGQYKYPTPYHDANNGPPNFLLRNQRDGTFRDVTVATGLNQNNTRYSFCCGWTDTNNDGWPDLYVVNDFGRKNLYRNNGDGTFRDVAADENVEDVGAGMSICSFDYDNDGAQDLYVADMWTAAGERLTAQEIFRGKTPKAVRALYRKHAIGNSLFRNSGQGRFDDQTSAAGVGVGRWAWSSDAWDFDHDGFPDLYVTNGMISGPIPEDLNSFFWRQVVAQSPDESKPSHDYEQGWNAINELIRADYSWSGFEQNVFYANNRDGTFSDVSGALGLDFVEDGRAFALADFDHDGRLEVLLKNRSAPQVRLLRNVVSNLPASLSFRLRGTKSNRDAIGASITIQTDAGRQTRMLQAGSGFLSQHSKEIFFGLGDAEGPIEASIRWPSGLVQSLSGLLPNHRILVEEGGEVHRSEPFQPSISQPAAPPSEQPGETLPDPVETWLLAPVMAPEFPRTPSELHGQRAFLYFWTSESKNCEEHLAALNRVHTASSFPLLAVDFNPLPDAESVRSLVYRQRLSFPVLAASEDTAAVYNILYRALFDRHRDLTLPTSLLLNEQGEIVKIYQGSLPLNRLKHDLQSIPTTPAERLAKALPFPGDTTTFTFGRNYLSLGSTYFQKGYFNEAGAAFQSALRDDPSSAEAHYGLGSVYLKQSKTADAQASFEQAVKQTSSYPETQPNAWNNLGLLAAQQGRTEAAVGLFLEALRLDPVHLVALQNLGNAYRQQQRWEDARRTLERALALAPDDPEVNYSVGMVFAQLDQPDRAFNYLQRALELRPIYPEAMNNLGVLYLRTHRRDQAVAEFEAGIRAAPSFNQSYLNLARVYLIEGDREKARDTLLALLKQNPNDVQAQGMLEEAK